jgi:hypothetical protein
MTDHNDGCEKVLWFDNPITDNSKIYECFCYKNAESSMSYAKPESWVWGKLILLNLIDNKLFKISSISVTIQFLTNSAQNSGIKNDKINCKLRSC